MQLLCTFTNKTSFLKKFSGYSLTLYGLFLLIFQNYFGFLFLLGGLSLLVKNGTEINLENKKYRDIYVLFNKKFGKWKDLPNIEYISIFKVKYKVKAGLHLALEHEFKDFMYRVQFFYNRNQKIIIFETKDKLDAIKQSKFIADILNLEIYDATEKKGKWL